MEYRSIDASGQTRWLRDDASIEKTGRDEWQVVGALTDITGRKRAELMQTSLHDILEATHAVSSLDDLYRGIHASLGTLIDFTGFAIALVADGDPNTFEFPYRTDMPAVATDGQPITIPRSRTAIVARSKQTLYMTAAQCRESVEAGTIGLYGSRPGAWLGSPLVVNRTLIGVVRITHSERHSPFTATDVEMMTYAAQHIAIAIDRRRTQDALRARQRLFQSVLDNVPDTIFIRDTDLKFVEANRACARSLGFDNPDDLIGLTCADVVSEDMACKFREEEEELLRTGKPIVGEVGRGGSGKWMSMTKAPLKDEDGATIGLVGINRDMSEIMAAQEALRESETHRTQLMEQMIAVQEEERARIARDLHDRVGQELTSVLIGLRVIESAESTEDATRQARELRDVTSNTLEDVRQIAFDMRPSSLDDLGMEVAIRRDLELLAQNAGFTATFRNHNDDDISLPTASEVGLYRIVHTALTNIVRHASASSVSITMRSQHVPDGDQVSLLIEDDGVGFDVEAVQAGPVEGRFGLLSMEERVKMLGGEVTVDSIPDEGTSVFVEVTNTDTAKGKGESMPIGDATSAAVRRIGDRLEPRIRESAHLEDAAQALAEEVYAAFEESVVLSRVFLTIPFEQLPQPNRDIVADLGPSLGAEDIGGSTPILSLMGTYGEEAAWHSRHASEGHVGIPLLSSGTAGAIPMISRLLAEFGVPVEFLDTHDTDLVVQTIGKTAGLFHVDEASEAKDGAGRKIIPAQDFVSDYGVRTVFGVGGAYDTGQMLVLVAFCRERFPRAVAERFLAMVTRFRSDTTLLAGSGRVFADS